MKCIKAVFLVVLCSVMTSAWTADEMKPYPAFKYWLSYGNYAFAPCDSCNHFAINASGNAYAALVTLHAYNSADLTVMMLKNKTWVSTGKPFSENVMPFALALNSSDPSATPYLAYTPSNSHAVVVDHFQNDTWKSVGANSLPMKADGVTLNVNDQGIPYLFYNVDDEEGGSFDITKLRVLMFNGSYWAKVGGDVMLNSSCETEAATRLTIAFDAKGTPFIAFKHPGQQYVNTLKIQQR